MHRMVTIPTPFSAGATYRVDITIWSTKKRDRGEFNVYLGSRLLVSLLKVSFRQEQTSEAAVPIH